MLEFLPKLSITDVLDIVVVSAILYWILLSLSKTRVVQVLIGLLFLLVLGVVAKLLHLYTLSFLFNGVITVGTFGLIVIFQPEIRRLLAKFGESRFGILSADEESERIIEEIVRAAAVMSEDRIGALIVIEREIDVDNYIESGTVLDAKVSKELLITIFWPGTPLHDGAVVVKKNRIYKAGAFLPLTLNPNLPQTVGTRHRAAIGISEETDAVTVVVSEETGAISVSYSGKLIKDIDPQKLKKVLTGLLIRTPQKDNRFRFLKRKFHEENL
ncbi:diadenylate cyclase [Balnearium lithotrophicum]|uniref:Diadenylate cyclase n=1 Tax=Balnearium lithotrophicum TaxID=223788 RepID=A0A521CZU3_9BACT|nr:diadenylate cyclase CdaA [Balnearium lithotrophicum]SMO64944.1 diadenylate cyclase [Balnearium lithotrophicum]